MTASVASAQAARAPGARVPNDAQIIWLLQNMPVDNAKSMTPLINALLSDTAGHMKMADRRVATKADSARAADVVREVRAALAPYRDVAAAERDGYVRFLPWLEEQSIYHYNSSANAVIAATRFDATKPTSLLYRKDAAGTMVLSGAMYTAPASSTPDELNARLPLGVAYWHAHVNFCGLRPASPGSFKADSAMLARSLAIDTREACTQAGGMYLPQLFGWMAHVNAFDGDSPSVIWGSDGHDHMNMHAHH
ncbi:MAG: hypothetical protein JWM95_990 [Gemmatimonadetes bacterium]|nr:hypothetical protein [Gemmatimonadota bacterium]